MQCFRMPLGTNTGGIYFLNLYIRIVARQYF
jgi:hypothetical protein